MVHDHQYAKNACRSTISGYTALFTRSVSAHCFSHDRQPGDSSYFIGFNIPLDWWQNLETLLKHVKTLYRILPGSPTQIFPRISDHSMGFHFRFSSFHRQSCSSPTAEARSSASAVSMAACDRKKRFRWMITNWYSPWLSNLQSAFTILLIWLWVNIN